MRDGQPPDFNQHCYSVFWDHLELDEKRFILYSQVRSLKDLQQEQEPIWVPNTHSWAEGRLPIVMDDTSSISNAKSDTNSDFDGQHLTCFYSSSARMPLGYDTGYIPKVSMNTLLVLHLFLH